VEKKPTQEQTERVKLWLNERLRALFGGEPSPPWPASIEQDMRNGVDFSGIFAEYGFAPNGVRLLPNFYEIQRGRGHETCPA